MKELVMDKVLMVLAQEMESGGILNALVFKSLKLTAPISRLGREVVFSVTEYGVPANLFGATSKQGEVLER